MKRPITREATGRAMSWTTSQVGPESRSSAWLTISLIASSWAAIRFGVKADWKIALMRSWRGGSIAMNMARIV